MLLWPRDPPAPILARPTSAPPSSPPHTPFVRNTSPPALPTRTATVPSPPIRFGDKRRSVRLVSPSLSISSSPAASSGTDSGPASRCLRQHSGGAGPGSPTPTSARLRPGTDLLWTFELERPLGAAHTPSDQERERPFVMDYTTSPGSLVKALPGLDLDADSAFVIPTASHAAAHADAFFARRRSVRFSTPPRARALTSATAVSAAPPLGLAMGPSPRAFTPDPRSPRGFGQIDDEDELSFNVDDDREAESVLEAEICHVAPVKPAAPSIRVASWYSSGSSGSDFTAPASQDRTPSPEANPGPGSDGPMILEEHKQDQRDDSLGFIGTGRPLERQSTSSISTSDASTPGAITPRDSMVRLPIVVVHPSEPPVPAPSSLRPSIISTSASTASLCHSEVSLSSRSTHRRKSRRPLLAPLPPPRRGSLVDLDMCARPPAIPRPSLPNLGTTNPTVRLPSFGQSIPYPREPALSLPSHASAVHGPSSSEPLPALDPPQTLAQLHSLLARQAHIAGLLASLDRLLIELSAQHRTAIALLDARELPPHVRGRFDRRLEGWWVQQSAILRASKDRAEARRAETDFWVGALRRQLEGSEPAAGPTAEAGMSSQEKPIGAEQLEMLPPPLSHADLDRQIWALEAAREVPKGTFRCLCAEADGNEIHLAGLAEGGKGEVAPLLTRTPLDRTAGRLPLCVPAGLERSITMKREERVRPVEGQRVPDAQETRARRSKVLSWIW